MMDETLYLEWENGFLQISDGRIAFKYDDTEGKRGELPGQNVICDEIENFYLLLFECNRRVFAKEIRFVICHKGNAREYFVNTSVNSDEEKKFLKFRDIMSAHGVFKNLQEADLVEKKEKKAAPSVKKEPKREIEEARKEPEKPVCPEEICFDLHNGKYIKIIGDELEIKHTYVDIRGIKHRNEVVRDKIKNFNLIYFAISLGYSVVIDLINEEKKYMKHMDMVFTPQKAKKFEKFRDIMEQNGCFENKSWKEINYGKETLHSIWLRWREEEFQRILKEEEAADEMKMIECPCCKAPVSNQAPTCPKCGQPIKLGRPKKIYRVTLFGGREWVFCPRCGSYNCSHYQEVHRTRSRVEVDERTGDVEVSGGNEYTTDRYRCNDCGNIFI